MEKVSINGYEGYVIERSGSIALVKFDFGQFVFNYNSLTKL